jgi:hypothetical protein
LLQAPGPFPAWPGRIKEKDKRWVVVSPPGSVGTTLLLAKGIKFVREPKEAEYGMVAVFEDLYGNPWDLLQLKDEHPIAQRIR